MKVHTIWFVLLSTLTLLTLAGCGGAAPASTQAPAAADFAEQEFAAATEPPMVMEEAAPPVEAAAPAPAATAAAFEIKDSAGENVVVQTSNRKIIKNGRCACWSRIRMWPSIAPHR